MFRVEYGETSNSGWAYRDFKDYKPATRFIEDFYNRADDVMRKRPDLEYWANILTDDPEDAYDFDVEYVTHFEEPETYIDVLEKGNSLNPIRESVGTKRKLTVAELYDKFDQEYGYDADIPEFVFYTKDNVLLGTSSDVEDKWDLRNLANIPVIEYHPGYHEYIVTLDITSDRPYVYEKNFVKESLNYKRRNRDYTYESIDVGNVQTDAYFVNENNKEIIYACYYDDTKGGEAYKGYYEDNDQLTDFYYGRDDSITFNIFKTFNTKDDYNKYLKFMRDNQYFIEM